MGIPAKYENGVFKPLENVELAEGTKVEVCVPAGSPHKRPKSVQELPFYGLGVDRHDITDGVSYVNNLRDNPRG
ncbi:MAG: antitoxin family protein [Bryobacteraceae bacterium]|jgi:Protein of unknown function DUF104